MRIILIRIDKLCRLGILRLLEKGHHSMQINELKVGHKARIVSITDGDPVYRHRLLSMGLLPGTEFTLSRMAPLGDPVEIQVRGFALSLRKAEASILQIEMI